MPTPRIGQRGNKDHQSPVVHNLNAFKAYEMRLKGHSYAEIAKKLDVSVSQANSYIKEGLEVIKEECSEKVEEMRRLELERLDAILLAHWPNRSLPRHADIILKLQERRAKLAGLDIPQTDLNDAATALRDFMGAAAANLGFAPTPTEPEESEESRS